MCVPLPTPLSDTLRAERPQKKWACHHSCALGPRHIPNHDGVGEGEGTPWTVDLSQSPVRDKAVMRADVIPQRSMVQSRNWRA